MSHPEQPRNNDKPKDQPKPKGAELFSLGKVKNAIMGNSLAKGLTHAVKTIYEQAEIKRETADAICGKILASGIFDSSEYENHLKSLHSVDSPAEKIEEGMDPYGPAEHQTVITGQDGILYKIESSSDSSPGKDEVWEGGYSDTSFHKLTFLNDNQDEMIVVIEGQDTESGATASFSITRNGKEIIHEELNTFYSTQGGRPFTTEEEIAEENSRETEKNRATACYRKTVSMPNISALLKLTENTCN